MKTNSSKIEKLSNKTFNVQFDIKKDQIQQSLQEVLKSIQANFETKGFRKGKAPLDVIQRESSFEKLFEEVASKVITKEYSQIVKENQLRPIIEPQVEFLKPPVDFQSDWQIKITSCELPEIKIEKDYLEKIKKINKDPKLTDENKKTEAVVKSLFDSAKLDLPEIIINSDLQHQLSHLAQQIQQVGITPEQYFENQKIKFEDYKNKLKEQIIKEWTINLSIQKIAQDEKIEISQEDIKEITQKNPQLLQNPHLVSYLITQQKVLEFLKK